MHEILLQPTQAAGTGPCSRSISWGLSKPTPEPTPAWLMFILSAGGGPTLRGGSWSPLVRVTPLHIALGSLRGLLLSFGCSAVSDSSRAHGLQHTRLPCPSPSPRTCSNSCLWSQQCHSTITSSVNPCFSCLQRFPASDLF